MQQCCRNAGSRFRLFEYRKCWCGLDWQFGFWSCKSLIMKFDARLPRYQYSVQATCRYCFHWGSVPLRNLPFLQFLPRNSNYTLTRHLLGAEVPVIMRLDCTKVGTGYYWSSYQADVDIAKAQRPVARSGRSQAAGRCFNGSLLPFRTSAVIVCWGDSFFEWCCLFDNWLLFGNRLVCGVE
jgi:hypothetical protein